MSKHALSLNLLTLALSGCAASSVPLSPHDQARLASNPASEGQLVYVGQVVPHGSSRPEYWYERRVSRNPEGAHVSTHLTYDTRTGARLVAWRAEHSADFNLQRFEEVHAQTGIVSSVEVLDDGGLRFRVARGDDVEQTVEPAGRPAVVGPTLVGFVLSHWDALLEGQPLAVRFAATDQGRSYGFTLALQAVTPTEVIIRFIGSNFIVRWGIAPITMTFDRATRLIRQYDGRVPARREDQSTVDATVAYTFWGPSDR